jgi:hypothetical protein
MHACRKKVPNLQPFVTKWMPGVSPPKLEVTLHIVYACGRDPLGERKAGRGGSDGQSGATGQCCVVEIIRAVGSHKC